MSGGRPFVTVGFRFGYPPAGDEEPDEACGKAITLARSVLAKLPKV
ncbi:MAG: hypothetical protein ACRDQ7_04305 [Haloechinothrix sp.]